MKQLKYYLSKKFFNQFIIMYIEYRQGNSLQDEVKKYQTNEDLTYISTKIYMRYIIKIIRLILTIIAITYFVGQYWFIMVQLLSLSNLEKSEKTEFYSNNRLAGYSIFDSFLKNDDWDLT